MNRILESAQNFKQLLNTEYIFTISVRRRIKRIVLSFEDSDFRHLAGLHYVDDIVIENNPDKTIEAILNLTISDELLNKSRKYKEMHTDGRSVEQRVDELRFLEEYLDKSDFIRIYEMQGFGSLIDAEYFIESSLLERNSTVYIFIRKREQSENYVIVSFFKKTVVYRGTAVYWLLKEKITNGKIIELYRNPSYIEGIT